MADINKDDDERVLPPSKRKPDDSCLIDAEDQSKKPKTQIVVPGEQLPSAAKDEVEEHSNGEAEFDRKGKGIMIMDNKGKGKMVEEDDESDDENVSDGDDSSDDDDDSSSGDEDSDLSDDPLAEVDLDNILPSRTRRRSAANVGISLGRTSPNDDDKADRTD